jgi:hypothetical protein
MNELERPILEQVMYCFQVHDYLVRLESGSLLIWKTSRHLTVREVKDLLSWHEKRQVVINLVTSTRYTSVCIEEK